MAEKILKDAARRAELAGEAFLDELSNAEFQRRDWMEDFFKHIRWHIENALIDVDYIEEKWPKN